ncbi:MAG: hypothetical protein ABIQ40_19820 [Bacteroidia bacterium]
MKKITLSIVPALFAAALLSLASCGGNKENHVADSLRDDSIAKANSAPKFEAICTTPNAVSVTIKGYKFGMANDFEAEMENFEVKQSSWNLINDSVAEMTLKNYTSAELVGDRKDNQVDINVEFRAKHGKKVEPGTFTTGSDPDRWVQATMLTAKGKVWFNWLAGMPEVGTVKLNYVGKDKACGVFALSSEKPENDQIGTVRVNGGFVVGE